jgi:UDP-N-acetyl-D-mannosaminuronate dehydrogenase
MQKSTVVLGLGEIGKPLFSLIEAAHHPTVGVDVQPVEAPGAVGVMHVCYPFDVRGGFREVSATYAKKYDPALIIIHSTVSPGTTRAIEAAVKKPCVYSPVRGKHTRMRDELQTYKKFVAGTDADAVRAAAKHLEGAKMKTESMGAPETLELAKLLETTYFGVLIAWAQEMDRMAKQTGGDYMEAAKFFAEIDYLPKRVFVPGFIGGHCVMPNIEILLKQFASPMLEAVKTSNAAKAEELGGAPASKQRIEPLRLT